jgi:tight adherence protein C
MAAQAQTAARRKNSAPAKAKWVYTFGDGKAEGRATMRNLLGGKGAGLAEMANLGLPVPPGFTITTEVCTYFYRHDKHYPEDLEQQIEAALDRVGRELADSYPSLSSNLYIATLEMRAGRTMSDALEQLAERLGLEEARSFATLLQQSEELGSSLTDALRVYSDDMRHKRMSIAEEKAYSLPAKLSVPLILCIFPVIIIVIMLPVYVQVKYIMN